LFENIPELVMREAGAAIASEPAKPDNRELLARALAMLSRRDAPRAEFIAKLIAAGFEKGDVENAADWCASLGFLNEARYTEGAARRLSAKYGAGRVACALRSKGVTEEAIAAVTPGLKENELAQARAIWTRKFREPPADAGAKARQVRYLQARGFSFGIIKQVIRGSEA
jgi:regulatory protein